MVHIEVLSDEEPDDAPADIAAPVVAADREAQAAVYAWSIPQLLLCLAAATSSDAVPGWHPWTTELNSTSAVVAGEKTSVATVSTTVMPMNRFVPPPMTLAPNMCGDAVVLERALALLARLCRQPAARAQVLLPAGLVVHRGTQRHPVHVFAVDVWLAALAHMGLPDTTREACLRSLLYCAEVNDSNVLERVVTFRVATAASGAVTTGVGILSAAVLSPHRLLAGNAALCLSKLALLPRHLPHLGEGIVVFLVLC